MLAIHDTDQARAEALVGALAEAFPQLPLRQGLGPTEVLVNCSAVGMGSDARMPCDAALIPGYVYDVVNRADTPLLVAARARGAICRPRLFDDGRSDPTGPALDAGPHMSATLRLLGLPDDARVVILHADDVGMCRGANRAYLELSRAGRLDCGSVMVPCPWFPEIALEASADPRSTLVST